MSKCTHLIVFKYNNAFFIVFGSMFSKILGGNQGKLYFKKILNHFSRTPAMHNTGGKQASISIGAEPVPPEVLQVSWASRLVCSDICGTV